ncbi:MAG: glycosyltransferase family 2 protein [Pseudomonadota bacterium]
MPTMPPPYDNRLSVVVPVKNEAENIEPLIREIVAALSGLDEFEIVYVDDGSTDGTLAELRRLAGELPQLRIVRHREACGQSTAITSGVWAAGFDWIATLDGDGQNDPADIPALLARLRAARPEENLHMLAGWRARRQDTWFRRFSSKVANGVRSRLLKDATPDTGCGLKVFYRPTFLRLPYFDHMHRFLPALVQRHGGRVVSVVVNHRPRERGTSKYGLNNRLWVGIVDLFGVQWLIRRAKRPEYLEP